MHIQIVYDFLVLAKYYRFRKAGCLLQTPAPNGNSHLIVVVARTKYWVIFHMIRLLLIVSFVIILKVSVVRLGLIVFVGVRRLAITGLVFRIARPSVGRLSGGGLLVGRLGGRGRLVGRIGGRGLLVGRIGGGRPFVGRLGGSGLLVGLL